MAQPITNKEVMMSTKRIASINVTKEQYEWLTKESLSTGNPKAGILRGLIQAQVVKSSNKGA